jgi:putative addiction module CopG family antidote
MPVDHEISVKLSEESLDFVQSKIASGEYESESEVLNDGITMLRGHEWGFEEWVREVAVPADERLKADPSLAIPLAEVKAHIAARRGKSM